MSNNSAIPDDPELDALSWTPTTEEADAYLRGKGVIKKCEVCGQDATLTNDFVTHLMKQYQAKCEELARYSQRSEKESTGRCTKVYCYLPSGHKEPCLYAKEIEV